MKYKLKRLAAKTMLQLPERTLVRLSGGEPVFLGGRTLDPRTQFILHANRHIPRSRRLPIAAARKRLDKASLVLAGKKIKMACVEDQTIPGPTAPIPIRIYTPKISQRPAPALVYYHGGGWAMGSIESHDETCRFLAQNAGCTVISVDYRLAPEDPFPAGLDDAWAALLWVRNNTQSLDIDPDRIAVGGDSAGGNLAAAICIRAKQLGEPQPKAQLLVYPVLDCRADTPSYETYGEDFLVDKGDMHYFIGLYLDQTENTNPLVSPLAHDAPEGLAPAVITAAGFDPLHDEAELYAGKLEAAGVQVHFRSYSALTHGYMAMIGAIPTCYRATLESATLLQTLLNS